MKRVTTMLAIVFVLSIPFSSTGYTSETETDPESSVATKTVTVTTIQRPFRTALRDLKNKEPNNKVRTLRRLRSKLRSLLGRTEDDTPEEEQEVKK
jgi:hypothetical protein